MTPFMVKIWKCTKIAIVFPKWERLFSYGKNLIDFIGKDFNNQLYLPKKVQWEEKKINLFTKD
jgi:hypothetical protein